MNDKDFQKKRLEHIYWEAAIPPIFRRNPKHCVNQFTELTPYISHKDLPLRNFSIRGCPIGSKNSFDNGKREIIIEYSTLEELVEDGWELD